MEDSVSWVGTEEQVWEEGRSWVVVQAWEDRSWGWASLCTPVWSVVEVEEEGPCKSVSWVGPSRRSHLQLTLALFLTAVAGGALPPQTSPPKPY